MLGLFSVQEFVHILHVLHKLGMRASFGKCLIHQILNKLQLRRYVLNYTYSFVIIKYLQHFNNKCNWVYNH